MATYFNIPPVTTGGTFSPPTPFSPYTPSSTSSYSSSHPLFSPPVDYVTASGKWQHHRPQSPSAKGYHHTFDYQPADSLPARPRKLRHRISHHIQRLWLWESSACVLAIAAHLAMIALLGVYDGSRESSWNQPWTLNSNIALMITIIKGAAMIPIAGSLGQLKWKRFWDYRRLTDMDVFDEASRGTLGSLRLLWHLKLWHFASIGAFLTVAALTMDTLAQNVVDTTQRLEVSGEIATLPRTNNYATFNMYTTGEEPGDQLPWPSMVTAISFGMSYTASLFWAGSSLPVICMTGNCTFGAYQTIGVDKVCHDVTSQLDRSDPDVYSLPGGPHLRKEDGLLNMSSSTTYPSNDLFADVGPLISNFQAITNPFLLDGGDPVAIQCVLYWAVGTFKNSNMTNYTLYEPNPTIWTNMSESARTEYNQTNLILLTPPECWLNGTQIHNASDERCTHWVHPTAQLGLQNLLNSSSIGMTGEVYKTLYGWSVDNLFANAVFQTVSSGLKNETYEWLETTVNNTAIMMTQGVRQLPFKADDGNWTYSYANGTTYNYETFYDIHFYYLGATHFVVGGSMVFMCLTIWLTRRDDPWKTSSLPLLFHGLTVQDRNSVPEVPQMVDMRIAADSMKVKMAMTPIGRRLATRDTIAS